MQTREKEIYKVTLTGSAVNLLLVILKFIAGIIGRSSAMVADAVHSLSDFHAKATEAEQALRAKFGPDTIINVHMEPV